MKKNIFFTLLLSFMCTLSGCTSEPTTNPTNPTTTPIIHSTEPSILPLQQENETAAKTIENEYIGNKNSKKFHRPDCRTLPAEKNRVTFDSMKDAINSGYSPCGNCIGS